MGDWTYLVRKRGWRGGIIQVYYGLFHLPLSSSLFSYVMAFSSNPWKTAQSNDVRYKYYIDNYKHYWPLDRLTPVIRSLVYQMLDPSPSTRISVKDILTNDWFKSIACCTSSSDLSCSNHSHPLKKVKTLGRHH